MATEVKALTPDSSPNEILKSMTSEQRKTWRETGDYPAIEEKKIETKTADSSPAAKAEVTEPEKKEEKVEAVAESAPAKVEPKAKGAEARIKELLSDNKRLNAELEAARKVPMVAPAKIEEVAKPRRNDVDERTGFQKYASDEAFDEAYESYLTTKVTKDVEKRHEKQQMEARQAEVNRLQQQKWQNALKLATEAHPDFAKVCEIDKDGVFQNAELKSIKTNGMVDAFTLDSEIGGSLLYYFAANPGEVKRIESIAVMSAFAAARELTRLEDKLSAPASTSKIENADGSNKVTKAPSPASNVGGRATAPGDEAEAALKRGDFKSYRKIENEKDALAKKKAS